MKNMDILGNVPLEVAQKCMLYINCNSILKLRYVSKRWKQIMQHASLWKNMCKIDKIADVNYPNETKISKNFMSSHSMSSYYERLWIYRTVLKQNWLTKPIVEILKPGLPDEVHFCDESIIVTHGAKKVQIYNADVKLLDAFTEKHDMIPTIIRKDDIIIAHYRDRFIMARNFKKRISLWKRDFKNLFLDDGIDLFIYFYGDLMAFRTNNYSIVNFMEILTGNIKFRIIVNYLIDDMTFYNNNLLTVSPKVWLRIHNVQNGHLEIRHRLDKASFRDSPFTEIAIEGSYLFINNNGRRGTMLIYDIKNGRKLHKFLSFYHITIKNSKLVYAESAKCIKIRDYTNNANKILSVIKTKNRMLSVIVNNNYIIVGTCKDILICDFSTGKVIRLISIQELFGEPEEVHPKLYATDTKLIVSLPYNSEGDFTSENNRILDFDIIM